MTGIKLRKLKGSALLMTMLILFGIIAVAFGGASLVIAGLRSSDLSAKSTVSYYNAEAGAERLLYEVRTGQYDLAAPVGAGSDHFSAVLGLFQNSMNNNGSYVVDYDQAAGGGGKKITFTSIGDYQGVKRSVEITF